MARVLRAKDNRSRVVQGAIESRLKEIGITQNDLIRESGISATALYNIKRKGEMSSQQFRELNRILNFSEEVVTEIMAVVFGVNQRKTNIEKKIDLILERIGQ